MTNGSKYWILRQPDQVSKNCFALIGAHQCGVLMVDGFNRHR